MKTKKNGDTEVKTSENERFRDDFFGDFKKFLTCLGQKNTVFALRVRGVLQNPLGKEVVCCQRN